MKKIVVILILLLPFYFIVSDNDNIEKEEKNLRYEAVSIEEVVGMKEDRIVKRVAPDRFIVVRGDIE